MHQQNILSYSDYRTFLKSYFSVAKERNPHFSYQAWARKLGLKNNTSLLKVINGQRGVGPRLRDELIRYFNFTTQEVEYFDALVSWSKFRESDNALPEFVTTMQNLEKSGAKTLLSDSDFDAISSWWYYAIRQMTRLSDFKDSVSWIHRRLQSKIKRTTIKKTIQVLLEKKLIIRNEKSKKLRIGPHSLTSSNDFANEALKRFHEGMLKNAQDSIRKVEVSKRHITGMTFALRESQMLEAKKMLNGFQVAFCEKFESVDLSGDQVYQLEIAFFPLTKDIKENER